MEITASQVKELREKTGAGMMECKTALTEAKGDSEEAVKILRKKGLANAAKKAGRVAAEGQVGCYIHAGGKIGVLVEVNCETDFVARTDDFQALVKDIAMHVAATNPRFVSREEVTQDVLDQEREIYKAQAAAEKNKPAEVIEKMVTGKMNKFYEEFCLLEQPFVKDMNLTVGALVTEKIAKMGENIRIRRFSRFALGEGIDKAS
jgi:elongation factor Ts